MARVGDELRDPWGLLFGLIAGGTAAAATVPIAAAAGIGVAVYGVKVLAGLLVHRDERGSEPAPLPVTRHSEEAKLLERAERAEDSFDELVRSARQGPIAERVATFVGEADEALGTLRRLAGQVSLVGAVMSRIHVRQLREDHQALEQALATQDDPRLRTEIERSLVATKAQLDAFERLSGVRRMLLARLASGTLGLEGLVAKLAEVVALTETSTVAPGGAATVDALMSELEGLRAGLTEAEQVSNQALTGLDTPATGSVSRGRRQTMPPR